MSLPLHIVNVELVMARGDRYLVIVRGEQEAHAPGTLSFPGGKVEAGERNDALEAAARRELLEEVGLEAGALSYLESSSFVTDFGMPVVSVVFLAEYVGGEPVAASPEEVAGLAWLRAAEICARPECPPWTARVTQKAEARRVDLGV
ncbi:8-oxo-dGTP diphosphatase [Deinobacterium chartae]|uniref:8-oxo-dGTP diphosphatase n=1 Tax=Deinobacterium chartae TaxID=521158 RepID=A0A841HXB2_9DEIO|nr:NUDIX domain-containing protein [Deinobacterium chartae]MBB6097284.1 8-oxo-dGTP diphosphatase [Deinobacterium chartae]